jgi:hypothetical protein
MNRVTKILVVYICLFVAIYQAQPSFSWPSEDKNSDTLTTNYGAPVTNNRESLTAGPRGPTLLEVKILTIRSKYFPKMTEIILQHT